MKKVIAIAIFALVTAVGSFGSGPFPNCGPYCEANGHTTWCCIR